VGQSPNSMDTYGRSMIVDPWGRVVDQASDGPSLIFGEIDLTYLARVRSELPALLHRKEF